MSESSYDFKSVPYPFISLPTQEKRIISKGKIISCKYATIISHRGTKNIEDLVSINLCIDLSGESTVQTSNSCTSRPDVW